MLTEVAWPDLVSVTTTRRQCSCVFKLDLDRLCRLAEALVTFQNPFWRFLRVLGVSPELSKSSSKESDHSLSFLCNPEIHLFVLYKYEAPPLQMNHLLPL